ncbi:MAG: DUF1905 domain-containing protein [Faecousia sp.]
MIYTYKESIYMEGSRAFIRVPFNVWEETGLKGNIPCRVTVEKHSFECKLIPKGKGNYLIPVPKKTETILAPAEEYEIVMEPMEALSRINHDSPYSRENPIRKIDGIETIPIQAGLCGHCCVAMLAGVPLAEVTALMGKAHASWSKILEALDYYGISHAEKAVYPKGSSYPLPECCIVGNDNRFLLWYQGSFRGVTDADPGKTISYIEVYSG